MIDDIDYRSWALSLCQLLDEVESAIRRGDRKVALVTALKRHTIAEEHGMRVVRLGGVKEGEENG